MDRRPSKAPPLLQRPELMKYARQLTPDADTMCVNLQLCGGGRQVCVAAERQVYPEHERRFQDWPQLLCAGGVTGRCYWEVEFSGNVHVAVSYGGIGRSGDGDACVFGENGRSWSLRCSEAAGFSAWHDKTQVAVSPSSSSSSSSNRVAVFVDFPAGTVSFFSVSSGELLHLHTFSAAFTEPLYPGFGLWLWPSSSVTL